MSPATIAHYRLGAKIGEGGMGEVYAATDTKLGRDVAIKIIPEEFAKDPDRMARFSREARLLASLNHPNIAAIYGVEERALVMELVDGATLADRMSAGPMPLDEAMPIIEQTIDALEYAHDKGIIHRDLKPGNIKITPEGRVKILDFGLAKAFTGERDASNPDVSPTLTIGASAGLILGTAAYMSPEQARGRAVDRRADIWSFGVIVYEMVTGERLFAGETVSDTLAAVLRHEIDFDLVPARLRTLTSACLERDLRRRMRDIGDGRLLLKDPAPVEAPRRMTRLAWMGWALALGLAGVSFWRMPRASEQQPLWASVDLGPDAVRGRDTSAAISPDGKKIVYLTRTADGTHQLAVRDLNEPSAPVVLSGTTDAMDFFFSPDGESVGFFDGNALKKVSVRGGTPVLLCYSAAAGRGGSWGTDGYIVFGLISGGLWRVHENGGTPELITHPEASGHMNDRWPQVLSGGESILFTSGNPATGFGAADLEVFSLKDRKRKTMRHGCYFGRYLPSGHLIFFQDRNLYAVPFNVKRLEIVGSPVAVLQDVYSTPDFGGGQLDFSRNGFLIYVRGHSPRASGWPLVWIDNRGKSELALPPALYLVPKLSPDGKRVLYMRSFGGLADLAVYDFAGKTEVRLTFAGSLDSGPSWTPDGKHVLFVRNVQKGSELCWVRATGGDQPHILYESNGRVGSAEMSPDGRRIVFTALSPETGSDLWTAELDISDPDHPRARKPEPLVRTAARETAPAISPDGKWIAYNSNASSQRPEIYVQRFAAAIAANAGKWQVSTGGGSFPIWSRSGHHLYYGDNTEHMVMVVDYTTDGDTFRRSKPRPFVETSSGGAGPQLAIRELPFPFDVSPDEKRIIAIPAEEFAGGPNRDVHLGLVVNWFDELRRRLPPVPR